MRGVKLVSIFFLFMVMLSCNKQEHFEISSPDGKIVTQVTTNDQGNLIYQVSIDGVEALYPSRLGIIRKDDDFSKGLKIIGLSSMSTVSEVYETLAEKKVHNEYHANRRSLKVENENGKVLEVVFQVSDDGVAFRYEFNEVSDDARTILSESTSFAFPETASAWLHPHDDVKTGWCETNPSYEQNYQVNIPVGTTAPLKAGWSFPALFQSNGSWVLITESGLEPGYCGTHLAQNSEGGCYWIEFPQKGETTGPDDLFTPSAKLPFHSPWRVIMVGSLANIVESNLVTALAFPSRVENVDFIKPGIASWSWGVEKDESVNYKDTKRYIDYASKMGWSYCLIDADWDRRIGYEKTQELIDYAASKNVDIILWYNSAGTWNTTKYTPLHKMFDPEVRRTEMKRVSEMGVKGLKVDFWPGDGPSAIQYYYDLLEDAAEFELMINCHGATVPRGWSRTFPHLMTMESVKGFEYITFLQETADKAPSHCAMLPFTRNAVGPMDFTPVCFGEIPNIQRRTSKGFELALSVLFQSGIQHVVEVPESMEKQTEYVIDFMKKVPGSWEDIRFIEGFPGKYVVLARKSGNHWYVAGVNGEEVSRKLTLDLSILDASFRGYIITDGEGARDFIKDEVLLENGKFELTLKPHGGFVGVF